MTRVWTTGDPERLSAVCDPSQTAQLVAFDHHRVVVDGRMAILITYHWLSLEETPNPLVAHAVFHPAPDRQFSFEQLRRTILAHPAAPAHIQSLVDTLHFHRIAD